MNALRTSNLMMLRDSTVTPLKETGTKSGFQYNSYRVQFERPGIRLNMIMSAVTNPPPEIMRLKKVIDDSSSSWVITWKGTINGVKMHYNIYDIDASNLDDASIFDVLSICKKH